jgi:hypothetical protein
MSGNAILNGNRCITIVRALVLLVAWTQLSYASHQFEHALEDAGRTCAVCVQFDRADDAVLASAYIDAVTQCSADRPISEPVAHLPHANFPYQSRASP